MTEISTAALEPSPLVEPFAQGPDALAEAIARLDREPLLSLPLLTDAARDYLRDEGEALPYRPARPVVGKDHAAVQQDFEVSLYFPRFPPDSPFTAFAAAFERLAAEALALLDPRPYPGPVLINDLIVQRYHPGSVGITPHRDHLRYEALVAIFPLSGRARFCVCSDRQGNDTQEIPSAPGDLLLMIAPGLFGRRERPFHFVDRIESRRVSLGLRYDVRAEDEAP